MSPRVTDEQLSEIITRCEGSPKFYKDPNGVECEVTNEGDMLPTALDLRDCRASHGELAAALGDLIDYAAKADAPLRLPAEAGPIVRARAALARARQETT